MTSNWSWAAAYATGTTGNCRASPGRTGNWAMIPAFPALVSALALLLYVAVFAAAGRARHRFDVKAPAVTGPPEFERAFRVQQNTLEQLVWFIPALWLFALYVSPLWGGIIGLVWIAGRAHYAVSY